MVAYKLRRLRKELLSISVGGIAISDLDYLKDKYNTGPISIANEVRYLVWQRKLQFDGDRIVNNLRRLRVEKDSQN